MNQFKEDEICKLCKKTLHSKYNSIYDRHLVRVKCGDWLDEVFHQKCWNRLKVYTVSEEEGRLFDKVPSGMIK